MTSSIMNQHYKNDHFDKNLLFGTLDFLSNSRNWTMFFFQFQTKISIFDLKFESYEIQHFFQNTILLQIKLFYEIFRF